MLPTQESPELIFAICSPVGTDNKRIVQLIEGALAGFGYSCERIKVTALMREIALPDHQLDDADVATRYQTYIAYANAIRDLFKMPSILAILCFHAIRTLRRKKEGSKLPLKQAYIIDQLKRPEEVEAFRQVYGPGFVLVSVYSEKERRIQKLIHDFARDRFQARPHAEDEQAAKYLVAQDEEEQNIPSGQRLRDAYAMADVFVNIDVAEQTESQIGRFVRALFGANDVSPTKAEYGMYLAKSASLRSLDLSRQVGAAIMSPQGEIISLGSNEVPKAGGGTYWCDDNVLHDGRDYNRGNDENDLIKRAILADTLRRLIADALVVPHRRDDGETEDKAADRFVKSVIERSKQKGSAVKDSLLLDILEFGRIIHAEMSAISDAARLGRATLDAVLYCTTFPCHICAKHIVASGIQSVIFIEPYPKSYAEVLHGDSIIVDVDKSDHPNRVVFSPFIGISPRRYQDIFQRGKRKDSDGSFRNWIGDGPRPIISRTANSHVQDELAFVKLFNDRKKAVLPDVTALTVE